MSHSENTLSSAGEPGALLRRLWHKNPPLALTIGTMALSLLAFGPLLFLDARTLDGLPVWVKPIKFALSIAVYSASLIWILSYLPDRPRLVSRVSWVVALAFMIEVIAIFGQAARGVQSHFNHETIFDAAVFQIMGIAIGVLFVAHLFVCVAVLQRKDLEATFASGLRLGLVVCAVGMAVGWLMVVPTPEQMAAMRAGQETARAGAHSVGLPDGGPGLGWLGWSTVGGDYRVAHFFGMHALQVLPLIAWVGSRNRSFERPIVRIAGIYYLGLTLLLIWQATVGESFVNPGPVRLLALGALTLVSLAALVFVLFRSQPTDRLDRGQSEQLGLQKT